MTTSMLACGRANAAGCLKNASNKQTWRRMSSVSAPSPTGNGKTNPRTNEAALQRELFVNVLNANATKRDAKAYLARFKKSRQTAVEPSSPAEAEGDAPARRPWDSDRDGRAGVNLGSLYAPARAIVEAPQFAQPNIVSHEAAESLQPQPSQLHVALICIRNPEAIDDDTLDGVATTLSQLVKLDMRIMIVLNSDATYGSNDSESSPIVNVRSLRSLLGDQALRISRALERCNTYGGQFVPAALEQIKKHGHINGQASSVEIAIPKLILDPLKRGVVPIVPSLAYSQTGKLTRVSSIDVMTALAKQLVGLTDIPATKTKDDDTGENFSLDRIIVLDAIGGVPSKNRRGGAHVFINLAHEFDPITDELRDYGDSAEDGSFGTGRPSLYEQHQHNLDTVRRCLAFLPSASSALIISPQEAAALTQSDKTSTFGAGTRTQRNTLIHNLLTNKPFVSSSLPTARLRQVAGTSGEQAHENVPAATLVKRGMPVTVIPAAEPMLGWQRPGDGLSPLRLEEDSRVNFARLLHLIEDSFRRKLDVGNYLSRIENHIAGIIVAGEYEGGAILTWEKPPGTDDPSRLVPYLDKFAVLQSSQGSSGVADIVFQAMVGTCFPQGVCWRSRKDNPVNKWYFERSAGSWQIPNSNWTMFWTGEGVVDNEQRWNDYVNVCRGVQPSWADGKKPE